jgi:hypothetical protein
MTIQPTVTRAATTTSRRPWVSIVIPFLNKDERIEECVACAFAGLAEDERPGDVIVVDTPRRTTAESWRAGRARR